MDALLIRMVVEGLSLGDDYHVGKIALKIHVMIHVFSGLKT